MRRALVIVCAVACGHRDPPRETPKPVPPDAPSTTVDARLIDAAPPIDAAVMSDAATNDQLTPPIGTFEIVDIKPDAGGSELTVGAGKDKGITAQWTAVILDDDGRPVARGDAKIKQVNDKTCRIRTGLGPDVMRSYHRVRLTPP